ncbi:Uncharacterised protein [Bordetella pertussis]|nr:Uncharacterised protein [Bordetella pertussis]CFP57829.1 Uncharacterised protein [Bordetella pertussis]
MRLTLRRGSNRAGLLLAFQRKLGLVGAKMLDGKQAFQVH